MQSLWPWLAIAGAGALHGLNPVNGWMFAAAKGLRAKDRSRARMLKALLPIAVGHVTSIGLVAATAFGASIDRVWLQTAAMLLIGVAAALHVLGRTTKAAREPAGQAGLAIWSFMMSSAHGAGLMLVPALMPLCIGAASGRDSASGSLTLALAAIGIHTGAMLTVTGVLALMAYGGFGFFRRLR